MAPIGKTNRFQRGLIEEIRQEGNEDQLKALNKIGDYIQLYTEKHQYK